MEESNSSNNFRMERYVNFDRHNNVWKVKVPKYGNTKVKVHKNFSVKKYGHEQSYHMAVEHRDSIMKSQENSRQFDQKTPFCDIENISENINNVASMIASESENEKINPISANVLTRPKRSVSSGEKIDHEFSNLIQDSSNMSETTSKRNGPRSWKSNSDGSVTSTSPMSTTPSLNNGIHNSSLSQPANLCSTEKENGDLFYGSSNFKRKRGRPSKNENAIRFKNHLEYSTAIISNNDLPLKRKEENSLYPQEPSNLLWNEVEKEPKQANSITSENNQEFGSRANKENRDDLEEYTGDVTSTYRSNGLNFPRRSKRKKTEPSIDYRKNADNTKAYWLQDFREYGTPPYILPYLEYQSFLDPPTTINYFGGGNNTSTQPKFTSSTDSSYENLHTKPIMTSSSSNSEAAMLIDAFFFIFSDLLHVCVPNINCTDRSRRHYDATLKSILRSILEMAEKSHESLELFLKNSNWIELVIPYITELSLPSNTLPMTQCNILNALCGLDRS